MASSFMGLYVQRDSLLIAQKALDITGNNISNIDTAGYSRQRVDICSVAYSKNTLGYNTAISLSGNGAEAVGVAQIRSAILDKSVRNYSGDFCNVGVKAATLANVEDIFDSIEADARDSDGKDLGVSFASLVNKLKSSLQSFSVDHADRAEIANITVNSATSLVHCINNYAAKLDDISSQTITDTTATVDKINKIFAEMADLNMNIKDAYISMGYFTSSFDNYSVQNQYGPLELKDKMNLLLDELSQYGNIDVTEETDGTFTVKFADTIVVKSKYYSQMAMTELTPRPTEMGFVLTSGGVDDFLPVMSGDRQVSPYGDVNKEVDYRIRGLKTKEEWHKLHGEYETGGNVQYLIRTLKETGATDNILNITGGTDGRAVPQLLTKGTLRGLLDVYNGRGQLYHDKSGIYANVTKQVEVANDALAKLASYNMGDTELTRGELEKLRDDIETAVGAEFKKDPATGNYSVTLNGTELLSADGSSLKMLEVDAKQNEDFAKVMASAFKLEQAANDDGDLLYYDADGNVTTDADDGAGNAYEPVMNYVPDDTVPSTELRTIYSNDYKGIEYYRDMLNSYVKTITDEFNGIYSDMTVTVDAAEYINSYAAQLALYNSDPKGSELTDADIDRIIRKLSTAGAAVDDAAVNADGMPLYEVRYAGITVTKTDGTSNKLLREDLPEDKQDAVLEHVNYELFTYNEDSFRTAANDFRVGQEWLDNPRIISNPTGDNRFEELNNVYINRLIGVFNKPLVYRDAFGNEYKDTFTPENFVSILCVDLGEKVSEEQSLQEAADVALGMQETLRSEKMDVSMEEEGINMMNYQKWYNAISRMISTMDEMLDKLINNTGIVGLR